MESGSDADFGVPLDPAWAEHGHPIDIEPRLLDGSWGSDRATVAVDAMTGVSVASLPLSVSPGRNGFTPVLQLEYRSGQRNGPFGLGWQLAQSFIGRRTLPTPPRYGEAEVDDDRYELDGEELVPALRMGAGWVDDHFVIGEYLVQRYRRRQESTHDRIEHWTHRPSGQTYWKVIDADNVTSLYGSGDDSRLSDPDDPKRTARWLLFERFDDRGNIMRWEYAAENLVGVDLSSTHERHRRDRAGSHGGWRYPKRISYGNRSPHSRDAWHFFVVFDYGDHRSNAPTLVPDQPWPVRPDPFSRYREGFELRQWRRCERVLMFHHFDELGPDPVLVSSTDFTYTSDAFYSLLAGSTRRGYIDRDGDVEQAEFAPVSLGYSAAVEDTAVRELDADVLVNTFIDPSARSRWMDLHDEGLPGVVSRLGDTWYFVRNLGAGRFAEPEPIADVNVPDEDEVLDLTFVEREPELSHHREYQPLTTLRMTGDVNQDDPYIGYIDLNGDSADDVVVADDRVLRWYPSRGEDGFGDPVVLRFDELDHANAHRLHFEKAQSFHLADMTGDGLFDLVRVRSGEVTFWSNCGRGRFADAVTMSDAPALPADTGRRTLMVDINGSGLDDLISIGDGTVTVWENCSGNRWGKARNLEAPGIHPDALGLNIVDLFGDGTAVITWMDQSRGPARFCFIAPAKTRTPRLLDRIANGLGLETRIAYAPSTQFWLRDRADGGSWLTAMPYPTTVVERIEERDFVAPVRRISSFAYHHGYFDTTDRRFVGFAFVERRDGVDTAEYADVGLFPELPVPDFPAHQRPPVRCVKTWRHTGMQFEDSELTVTLKEAFFDDPTLGRRRWLVGPQLPLGQQARDIPLGHRALRGSLLRRETYVLDGPPNESIPFLVEEETAWVRQVQPARSAVPPSYDTRLNERVTVTYERDTTDPRVHHCLDLAIGDFGQVLQSACIDYGALHATVPNQSGSRVRVAENAWLNRHESQALYRLGIPVSRRTWSVQPEVPPNAGRLYEPRQLRTMFEELPEVDALVDFDHPHRRLSAETRWRYWSNDGKRQLPIGEVESRALLARTEQLALTTTAVDTWYGKSASDTFRFEGGYFVDGPQWWAPSPTTSYDAARFYVPTSTLDALGRQTRIRWNDSGLFVQEVENGYGAVERQEWHPRVLQPWRRIDANGNVVARRFDPLGRVYLEATQGSVASPTGDGLSSSALEAHAEDNPTVVTTYDDLSYIQHGVATSERTRHRTEHGGRPNVLRETIRFADGHGRTVARTTRTADRWRFDSIVARDADDVVVLAAEPMFADEPRFDDGLRAASADGASRYWTDGLGRVVRTDHGDGTFSLRSLASWAVTDHRANDTVLDSRWYAERSSAGRGRAGDFAARQAAGATQSMRAAALSAAHARTPDRYLLDPSGTVVALRRTVATGDEQLLRRTVDVAGHTTDVIDGRGNEAQRVRRDLLGRVVVAEYLDAGRYIFSWSASGELLQRQDPDQRLLKLRYDAIGHRTHVVTGVAGSPNERVVERTVWGGGDIAIADETSRNLLGRPHARLTASGVEVFERYDAAGLLVKVSLQLASDGVADWSFADELTRMEALGFLASSHGVVLEEPIVSFQVADAFGDVTAQRVFDRVQLQYERVVADGSVDSVTVSADRAFRKRTLLSDVRYGAHGKPSSITFDNGVNVERFYDSAGRLTALSTTRSDGQNVQDLRVTHDANGNVMSISNDREIIDAFTYDGADRLVRAEGFAFDGLGIGSRQADEDATPTHYANAYHLDRADNLVEVHRSGGSDELLRAFTYPADHNRLKSSSGTGADQRSMSSPHEYDEHGNLTVTVDPPQLEWDPLGRLSRVTTVDGAQLRYHYDARGGLRRRVIQRSNGVREDLLIVGVFERHRTYRDDELTAERFTATAYVDGVPMVVGERATVLGDDAEEDAFVRYLLVDHVGSLTHELDEDGTVITRESYLPFGSTLQRTTTEQSNRSSLRLGFRSGRYDADADLVVFGTRWYSPLLGRWADAIGGVRQANPYVFNNANPQSATAEVVVEPVKPEGLRPVRSAQPLRPRRGR